MVWRRRDLAVASEVADAKFPVPSFAEDSKEEATGVSHDVAWLLTSGLLSSDVIGAAKLTL